MSGRRETDKLNRAWLAGFYGCKVSEFMRKPAAEIASHLKYTRRLVKQLQHERREMLCEQRRQSKRKR